MQPASPRSSSLPRDRQRPGQRRPRRMAGQEPLASAQRLRPCPSVISRDGQLPVEDRLIVDSPGRCSRPCASTPRVHEVAPLARPRSPGFSDRIAFNPRRLPMIVPLVPMPGYEVCHSTARLLVDLACRRSLVRRWVRLVGVLVRIEVALRRILDQLPHLPDRAVGLLEADP